MNDFAKEMNVKPSLTILIQKGTEIDADTLEEHVRNKFSDKESGKFSLVYVYYYADKEYQYPEGKSNVLYIGKTIGQKKDKKISAAYRFKHLKGGSDYKQNITLSAIYNQKDVIGLDIFEVEDCGEVEKKWRYSFLNKFKALPIADGAAYSKEKCFSESDDEKIEDCE